jgi:hypothetical protein
MEEDKGYTHTQVGNHWRRRRLLLLLLASGYKVLKKSLSIHAFHPMQWVYSRHAEEQQDFFVFFFF